MKKITILFLFLPIFHFLSAQTPQEQEAVKQLIQEAFDEIWSNLDSTKISRYHTDDFLLLENGEVWDNETVKKYIRNARKRNDPSVRQNRFEYLRFMKSKKSIWVAYHNYAKGTSGEKLIWQAHWLESAVVVKTPDGWRIQMLHSTRVGN
jgi:hypothetical protein